MRERKTWIDALKGIAIISVVYAHCNNRISMNQIDQFLECIRGCLGTLGVPIFMILSGYLFNNNRSLMLFLKNKIRVVLPWIFWGTAVWLYEVFRKGLGYAKLLDWLLGFGTYLWFMRTIMIFWVFFYFIRKRELKVLFLIVAVILRILIYDINDSCYIGDHFMVSSIVCHLPFFVFGMVAKEYEWDKLYSRFYRKEVLLLSLIVIIAVMVRNDFLITYESPLFLVYIGAWYLILYEAVVHIVSPKWENFFAFLGKNSYLIYLVHMPVAGIVSNLFSRTSLTLYFVLLYPLIAVAIVVPAVYTLNNVFGENQVVSNIIGTRQN